MHVVLSLLHTIGMSKGKNTEVASVGIGVGSNGGILLIMNCIFISMIYLCSGEVRG